MPPSAGNCVGCVGSRGNSDDATASAVIRGMTRVPAVDHRTNNFDFLRFVAASLVLYSHCFALTGMGGHEPLTRLTHGDYVFAGLAVRVFFVISGYLVMQSWLRRPRLVAFTGARCLRIFPGLAVALAYCVAGHGEPDIFLARGLGRRGRAGLAGDQCVRVFRRRRARRALS